MIKNILMLFPSILVCGEYPYSGSCCPFSGSVLSMFSERNQLIAPQEAVHFEKVHLTSKVMDLSDAAAQGLIRIQKTGIYLISWRIEGQIFTRTNCSFGLCLDDQVFPNTVVAEIVQGPKTLHPAQGSSLLVIEEGQILRLLNTSANAIQLIAELPGDPIPFASASFHAELLVEL